MYSCSASFTVARFVRWPPNRTASSMSVSSRSRFVATAASSHTILDEILCEKPDHQDVGVHSNLVLSGTGTEIADRLERNNHDRRGGATRSPRLRSRTCRFNSRRRAVTADREESDVQVFRASTVLDSNPRFRRG